MVHEPTVSTWTRSGKWQPGDGAKEEKSGMMISRLSLSRKKKIIFSSGPNSKQLIYSS